MEDWLPELDIGMLFDYQIVVSVIAVLCAWSLGDWRNWRAYYPTILYFIVGEFLYGILCYNYPLWSFESPLLKQTFSEVLIAFVFYPSVILIYLPHMPDEWKKRIPYILMWAGIFTIIEQISVWFGYFSHHYGWNIWLSALFNCVMFPILWLHHRKPLWADLLLVVCAGVGIWMFGVPIESMK